MILHEEPDCILEPADYGPGWDDGTARRKIEDWIDKFAAEQFPEMNRFIVDCLNCAGGCELPPSGVWCRATPGRGRHAQ